MNVEASRGTAVPVMPPGGLTPDMLLGAAGIAEFLYGDRNFRRKVYHLTETSRLPVFRLGSRRVPGARCCCAGSPTRKGATATDPGCAAAHVPTATSSRRMRSPGHRHGAVRRSKIHGKNLVVWRRDMASATSVVMNKVDRERADVLRAELARLCWLISHDTAQDGESERLVQSRWSGLAKRDLSQAATPTDR